MASEAAVFLLAGATLVGGAAIGKAAVDHVIDSRAGRSTTASPVAASGSPARPLSLDSLDGVVAVVATVIGTGYILWGVPELIDSVSKYVQE